MNIKTIKSEFVKKKLPKIVGAYINTLAIFAPMKAGKLALDIFCTPRNTNLREYQHAYLNKVKYKTFDYNGIPIQTYRWSGGGKRVLLAHGWESNTWRWRKLIKELQHLNLDIYALDAPAHGNTGGKYFTGVLYAEMMDKVCMEIQPEIVIGHSIGSFASLYYKAHYSTEFIQKLILLASPDKMTDITSTYHSIIGLNDRGKKAYYDYFKKVFTKDLDYYAASHFASTIECPGVLIHDEEDVINFYKDGVSISKAWKNVTFYTTKGHGHSLQHKDVFDIVIQEITK